MKNLSLWLLTTLLAITACKKNNSTPDNGNPNTNPPVETKPVLAFSLDRYGNSELWALIASSTTTAASLQQATPGTGFTYEVTGANGMKTSADTTIKGSGQVSNTGIASFYFPRLFRYKDGVITVKLRFDNSTTTIEASTKKEEFTIRNYKDIIGLNSFSNPGELYTQVQDISFPDTTFLASPVYNPFYGSYDGQGYKIKNLTIEPLPNTLPINLGLFTSVNKGSVIKNIRLELSSTGIKSTAVGYNGGIAGQSAGAIINCSVKGFISGGSTSTLGGIVGKVVSGRVTGCAFRGSMLGYMNGGIVGFMDSGYVNMCYADFSLDGTAGGGLVCNFLNYSNDGIPRDTVLNSYAYISPFQSYMKVFSLFYASPADTSYLPCIYENCYSNNTGIPQKKAILSSTTDEMNNKLVQLQVSNIPSGIPAPPTGKPFKTTSDANQTAILWWE